MAHDVVFLDVVNNHTPKVLPADPLHILLVPLLYWYYNLLFLTKHTTALPYTTPNTPPQTTYWTYLINTNRSTHTQLHWTPLHPIHSNDRIVRTQRLRHTLAHAASTQRNTQMQDIKLGNNAIECCAGECTRSLAFLLSLPLPTSTHIGIRSTQSSNEPTTTKWETWEHRHQ